MNISPGPSPQISALPLGVGQIPRFCFHSTGAGPRLVMAAYHGRAVMADQENRGQERQEKKRTDGKDVASQILYPQPPGRAVWMP